MTSNLKVMPQVVEAERHLINPVEGQNTTYSQKCGGRLDKDCCACATPKQVDELFDLRNLPEIRQHDPTRASLEHEVDLLGSARVKRIDPHEEVGGSHGILYPPKILNGVLRDAIVERCLAFGFTAKLQVDSDSLDASGIGGGCGLDVGRQQSQLKFGSKIMFIGHRISGRSVLFARQLSGLSCT